MTRDSIRDVIIQVVIYLLCEKCRFQKSNRVL